MGLKGPCSGTGLFAYVDKRYIWVNEKLEDRQIQWPKEKGQTEIQLSTIMDQELTTHLKHLRAHPAFSGVRVARSLVFCVVYCR
jgi:hypothetical protein